MHFVSLTMHLRVDAPRRLTIADSAHAHAAVLHLISNQDAYLGRALHDAGRHKRVTMAIVSSTLHSALLRLTLMAEEGLACGQTLLRALAQQPLLRIGQYSCMLDGVDLSNGKWCGVSTWADLCSPGTSRLYRFDFVTPTAITKRSADGGRFTALLPEPVDVFSGLARRWEALAGPTLPQDLSAFVEKGGCVVNDYWLHAAHFRTSERTQIGFTGTVLYECLQPDALYLSALQRLTRLAFYSGVGYQTARGMGAVRTASLS